MEAFEKPVAVIDEHKHGLITLAIINIFIIIMLSPIIVGLISLYTLSSSPEACCNIEGSRIICSSIDGVYKYDLGLGTVILAIIAVFLYVEGVRYTRKYPIIEIYNDYMLLRFPLGKVVRTPKSHLELVVSNVHRGSARVTINPFGIEIEMAVRDIEKLRETLKSVWGIEPKIKITE